jgi:hypothetical protein
MNQSSELDYSLTESLVGPELTQQLPHFPQQEKSVAVARVLSCLLDRIPNPLEDESCVAEDQVEGMRARVCHRGNLAPLEIGLPPLPS